MLQYQELSQSAIEHLCITSIAVCGAEQGRLHAARSLASGLAQFIKTTAATLVHHGTINAELQGACHAAFKM